MNTILKMYRHVFWANERILAALRGQEKQEEAQRLFAHILNAERVWHTRIRGQDSASLPIWGNASFEECADLAKQNEQQYLALLENATEAELDRLISYANQHGIRFQTSMRDILIHVALHGQYHRGQVNALLRAGGKEPAQTDYIAYVRQL